MASEHQGLTCLLLRPALDDLPWRPGEDIRFLGARFTGSSELSHVGSGNNSEPLEEQLLTTGAISALQHLNFWGASKQRMANLSNLASDGIVRMY